MGKETLWLLLKCNSDMSEIDRLLSKRGGIVHGFMG